MRAFSRREFSRRVALAGLAASWGAGAVRGASAEPGQSRICLFSKHVQWLKPEDFGELLSGLGYDGVELTVRSGGHIDPKEAPEKLKSALSAVRQSGLEVPSITTSIVEADELSRRILATAAENGVKYYRLGYYLYRDSVSLDATLDKARRSLEGLARLNEQLGIVGDYQNHSGPEYLGAAIWDLWYVMKDLDPRWIGSQFDLRHATLEGGESWPTDFLRVADRVHTIVAKDFRWDGAKPSDCPLGQGVSDYPRFLPMLAKAGFRGPVVLHLEYPLGGADTGARQLTIPKDEVIAAMRRDLTTLKGLLKQAGLRA